jgi:hypothetical protein
MAVLEQIRRRAGTRHESVRPERGAPRPGTYLTDGTSLFRVGEILGGEEGLLVELEDCATLETVACSPRLMARAGMRPVEAASV